MDSNEDYERHYKLNLLYNYRSIEGFSGRKFSGRSTRGFSGSSTISLMMTIGLFEIRLNAFQRFN